jgi:hypothetical protein
MSETQPTSKMRDGPGHRARGPGNTEISGNDSEEKIAFLAATARTHVRLVYIANHRSPPLS